LVSDNKHRLFCRLDLFSVFSRKRTVYLCIRASPFGHDRGWTIWRYGRRTYCTNYNLVAAILVYLSFDQQRQANKIQVDGLAKQQFDNSFYNSLTLLSDLIDGEKLTQIRNEYGNMVRDETEQYDDFTGDRAQVVLEQMVQRGEVNEQHLLLVDQELSNFLTVPTREYLAFQYVRLYNRSHAHLGHIFRFIFNMIKSIDDSEFLTDDDKSSHINLIQALLPSDALGLLFYNALSDMGRNRNGDDEFRQLLDHYGFLENVDRNSIIHELDCRFYPETNFRYADIIRANRRSR
jgi:hypothetical protein